MCTLMLLPDAVFAIGCWNESSDHTLEMHRCRERLLC